MSLRVAIHCPFCKRPMAASSAFAGQMIACPNCRGEFLMSPPGMTPPPATPAPQPPQSSPAVAQPAGAVALAAPPVATPQAPRPAAAAPLTPIPVQAAPAAVPLTPAQPPPNTARLKTAASQAPAIAPAADGKLPTLQLADAAAPTAKGAGGERGLPVWALAMLVVASTVVSAILLLGPMEGTQSTAARRAEARRQLATHYASGSAQPRPYQVLLREAQQAHTRGDLALERRKYREVLALLHAEGRTQYDGLTGARSSDAQLEKQLSIMLAGE